MDNYKTIIEIGSFSIKTIIFSELNQEFSIIGTGKTRSRGYNGEEIENFDDFIDSIKNSIVQAEEFRKSSDLAGAIITKLDGTAKGGVVFPLYYKLKIPVNFVGVGEGIRDLKVFEPNVYVDGIMESL